MYCKITDYKYTNFAWVKPLNKSGLSITKGFKTVLSDRIPEKIWVDRSCEFYNKTFKSLF